MVKQTKRLKKKLLHAEYIHDVHNAGILLFSCFFVGSEYYNPYRRDFGKRKNISHSTDRCNYARNRSSIESRLMKEQSSNKKRRGVLFGFLYCALALSEH